MAAEWVGLLAKRVTLVPRRAEQLSRPLFLHCNPTTTCFTDILVLLAKMDAHMIGERCISFYLSPDVSKSKLV